MNSTISRFGCPLKIHTDQGNNVDGNLIYQPCDLLEISKTRTTAYRLAPNGQVERYNRLLTQMIHCYIQKNKHNSDAYLQQLTGAIRSTENRQTGFIPNCMIFGRENVHPIDSFLGLNMAEKQDISEYVKNLRDTLVEVHYLARTNIKAAQMRQKKYYDVVINYRTYKVGDVVLKVDTVRKIGVSPKLKSPWKGPYIVLEVKSPVLYRIKNKKTIKVVHHDRLKLCNDREFPKWLRKLRSDITNYVESIDSEQEREEEVDLDIAWMFDEDMVRRQKLQSGFLTDSILTDGITQSESLTDKYLLDKTPQSDCLTCIPDLDRSNQSGSLIDSVANPVRFTLRDWENLLNLSNDMGDQTIVYELDSSPNATSEIALQSTSNTKGQQLILGLTSTLKSMLRKYSVACHCI